MLQTLVASWPYLVLLAFLIGTSFWASVRPRNTPSVASKQDTLKLGRVHLWGTGALVGLIVLSALSFGDPLILYSILALAVIWILAPAMSFHSHRTIVIIVVMAGILAVVGYVRYAFPPTTRAWLASSDSALLPTLHLGAFTIPLSQGAVTHQSLALNAVCLAVALIGIVVSFVWSLGENVIPSDDTTKGFSWSLTVLYMGAVCAALLMYAVSRLQQLRGLASLYLLLAVASFGWLLLALVARTLRQSLGRASDRFEDHFADVGLRPFPGIATVPYGDSITPPINPHGGPLDQFAYALEAIIVNTTNAMTRVIYGLINLLIHVVNGIVETIRRLTNLLIRIVVWIALYLWEVLTGFITNVLRAVPWLYRRAVLGFRTSLFAPALVVITGVLLILCADAGISYLAEGHLPLVFTSWIMFAGAALAAAWAGACFINWKVVRSFGSLSIETYAMFALLLFPAYLDVYGLERQALHAPSHFGVVSWVLTIVLGGISSFIFLRLIVLRFILRRETSENDAAKPAPLNKPSRVLAVIAVSGLFSFGVYGMATGLPSVLAQEARGEPISGLGLGRAPGVYVPPVVIPPPPPISTVYVGSSAHGLYALQASNGSVVWQQIGIAGGTGGKASIAEGILYLGGWGGSVYAFTTSTGSLRWKSATGGHILSSPTVTNGVVYIGSNDGYLYALRANDGSRMWRFQSHGYIWSTPQTVNGIVYFGSLDGYVYAVRARDGLLAWRFRAGDWILSSPTVAGGVVYVGSRDHYLYALRASDGTLLWRFRTGDVINTQPAVANGVVYVGSHDTLVYALHAADGSLLWSHATTGLIDSSPVVSQGLLYIGDDDHYLYALHTNNGSLAWRHVTGGQVTCTPLVANGNVYVDSWDGTMYALNASHGTLIWTFHGGFDQASPVGA